MYFPKAIEVMLSHWESWLSLENDRHHKSGGLEEFSFQTKLWFSQSLCWLIESWCNCTSILLESSELCMFLEDKETTGVIAGDTMKEIPCWI